MEFRISDTFTDSLARLTGEEQKAVKTTAFDLQIDPANPGMSFHKLDKAKDKNFWSVRVSSDIRLIVHRTPGSLLLCYVDHHDKAYDWAERRKLEVHPNTGAAQLIEVRERIQEIVIQHYSEEKRKPLPKIPMFINATNEELLGYGVPEMWIPDVKNADEDSLLELVVHLPSEAAEALLDLATGKKPLITTPLSGIKDPFEHPDAKRRFRVMHNVEELEQALEFPWEKWSVFLHPEQQQIVDKEYPGPARVSGSAGTGKTIVALHRAVSLAKKHIEARVLLTTFSEPLANALRNKLKVLLKHSPRIGERLEVYSIDEIGGRLYKLNVGSYKLAGEQQIIDALLSAASEVPNHKFTNQFLLSEWTQIVDAWQLKTWEQYRDVVRLGRKTRLQEKQRQQLWSIFEKTQQIICKSNFITSAELFHTLSEKIPKTNNSPFEYVVIDEAQDVSVPQLRFLASLGANRENCLFFAGDLGQRIFQQPFSWKSLGVDIRGRSKTLRINYRTSHQIRKQADQLLGPELSDVDGNKEDRRGTISVFNGPEPQIEVLDSSESERNLVSDWLKKQLENKILAHEIGIFVRSETEVQRAVDVVKSAGLLWRILDNVVETEMDHISVGTMHLAKGLEFRAVAVMACDDEIIPSQKRLENGADDAELEEIYNTERQLLYVACTRARDSLLVTGVEPGSEFIDDLKIR
jgi:mRNA-degrading endonuclease RelE of RelBE toxin-antitoxin system